MKKGFTLVELIVVIAVLGILVLLASPKFTGHVEEAKLTQIKNDVRAQEVQLGSKMFDNENFLNEMGQDLIVDPSEMESKKESIYDYRGIIKQDYTFSKDYYKIPKEYLVNTQLKGDFVVDSEGKVFYTNGVTSGGSTKPPVVPTPPADPGPITIDVTMTDKAYGSGGTFKRRTGNEPHTAVETTGATFSNVTYTIGNSADGTNTTVVAYGHHSLEDVRDGKIYASETIPLKNGVYNFEAETLPFQYTIYAKNEFNGKVRETVKHITGKTPESNVYIALSGGTYGILGYDTLEITYGKVGGYTVSGGIDGPVVFGNTEMMLGFSDSISHKSSQSKSEWESYFGFLDFQDAYGGSGGGSSSGRLPVYPFTGKNVYKRSLEDMGISKPGSCYYGSFVLFDSTDWPNQDRAPKDFQTNNPTKYTGLDITRSILNAQGQETCTP